MACARLTGAGLYWLAFTHAAFAVFLLFALVLGWPPGRRGGCNTGNPNQGLVLTKEITP